MGDEAHFGRGPKLPMTDEDWKRIKLGYDIINPISSGCGALNVTEEAVKADNGKPDMSLLSSISIIELSKVLSYGKEKYASHNWRKGFNWTRIIASCLRHIFAWLGGEDKDPETQLSHLSHAMCNLMFLVEFEHTHKDKDDRYKK